MIETTIDEVTEMFGQSMCVRSISTFLCTVSIVLMNFDKFIVSFLLRIVTYDSIHDF